MPLDDETRLRHLIEAAEDALRFCRDMTREQFETDNRTQRAVVQCLTVIGEAANTLSEDARSRIGEVPWDNIIGMRHRLTHEYFVINLDIVWATVQEDLSPLIESVKPHLPPE